VSLYQFMSTGKTVTETSQFSSFQNGGCLPSWICSVQVWTTQRDHSVVLSLSKKFGWNRCSSFDYMKVVIFIAFGLKMPIHAL